MCVQRRRRHCHFDRKCASPTDCLPSDNAVAMLEPLRSAHEVLSSEARLRSSYAAPSDNGLKEVTTRGLYARETNRTQPITQEEKTTCSGGIAQRLEALRKSGEDWQKRVDKSKQDITTSDIGASSPVSVLRKDAKIIEVQKSPSIGDRKSWLESSSESWRQRVQESDASQFTVAGKMGISESAAQLSDRKKKTPKQEKFSAAASSKAEVLRRIHQQGTPVLPAIFKSKSMPNAAEELSRLKAEEEERPRILIPKADNETFTSFFESVLPSSKDDKLDISEAAFDAIVSDNVKLGQRKQISVRRKRQTKGNPLKKLASRTDIQTEYVEVRTDVAEKELKRMNIEKLAKSSDLALSALAGLASTEDFRRVQLKKSDDTNSLLPNRDLILIQVKGRRHVQTRLVEPSVSSLNHGDVFVLVTPSTVYCWIGRHSNVIERAKATDVAQSIQSKKDLLFKGTSEVKIIDDEKEDNSKEAQAFFKLLGGTADDCNPAGDPGEDLWFEAAVVDTNMVYTVEGDALVPYDKYWGMQPRVEMLQPDKAYVFNFGSEVYVWLGKLVPSEMRDLSVRLAEEQCKAGFNYSDCDINPLFPRAGPEEQKSMASDVRPNWTLFAKVNQHMEPVLFKEKFLDWPDDAKLIRVKNKAQEDSKAESLDSELKPCDAKELLERRPNEPDLELSGSHLGRGLEYYDSLERRQYYINTLAIKVWHITEYEHRTLPESSYGQFYSGDTYVVRWQYAVSQTGRHLSGQRSRHVAAGRERCAYFFWHGRDSTVTEKGACALLTVELDEERGPHVRVLQGREPPCFLNLFKGKMVVYNGKRQEEAVDSGDWHMFVVRGECPLEAALVETPVGVQNLRSRGSFLVLSRSTGRMYLWHGTKCSPHSLEVAQAAAKAIVEETPTEMAIAKDVELKLTEVREGAEERGFWDAFGGDKKKKQHLFVSLLDSTLDFDFTPRLFHMTLVSGTFEANEVFCPFQKTDVPCAYPFLQSDLYNAPQPAVFFLDNRHEMYIWQGWWPANDSETGLPRIPNSSEKVRWNTTRRLAMETALHYSQETNPSDPPKVYLVFAGLEPVEFTCLFPEWQDRDDIATINIREDRTHGDRLSVQETLAQLTKTHYTLEELKSVPLPEGVDPQRLESYLTDEDFEAVFECTKAKFYGLPNWMQNKHKKQAGLF